MLSLETIFSSIEPRETFCIKIGCLYFCDISPRRERVGPTVLCLSPTRELAQQIQSEVDKYSYKGIRWLVKLI